MAIANLLKSNFAGGEQSPEMEGRPDLGVFASGSRILDNFLLTRTGSAVMREGFEVVVPDIADHAFNVEEARLIPMNRPLGEFSLLLFGWQEAGVAAREIVVMREYPVAGRGLVTDKPIVPLTDVPSAVGIPDVASTAPPAKPRGLAAEEGFYEIFWVWEEAEGATSYDVQLRSATATIWPNNVLANVAVPRYRFITNRSWEYEVRVRARNDYGVSDWSDTATGETGNMFARPQNLMAVQQDDGLILVTFEKVLYANRYELQYRFQPASEWVPFVSDQTSDGRLEFTGTLFDPGVRFGVIDFRVRTSRMDLNALGIIGAGLQHLGLDRVLPSDWTDPVSVTFTAEAPAAPANITVDTAAATGRVRFGWDAVAAADSYRWRARRPGVDWGAADSRSGETTETQVTLAPFATSPTLEFQVRALNTAGVSGWAPLPPASGTANA